MAGTEGRGAAISTLASLASLAAALSCCLPLGTLLMAAGSAGASLLSERLRPWLLIFSVASLVFAFVQTYYRRRCAFSRRRLRTVLLWFSTVTMVSMLVAPGYVASVLAGHLPYFSAASVLAEFNGADFVRQFDEAAGQTRIVALLSPT